VLCLAATPDGGAFVSGGEDGSVRTWDARGQPRLVLRGHLGPVTCVTMLGPGRVATGGLDRTVKVWDLATGRLKCSLGAGDLRRLLGLAAGASGEAPEGHGAAVTCLAPLPGDRLLSAAADGTVLVWDTAAGKLAQSLPGAEAMLDVLAVDRDRKRAFAAGRAADVWWWDLTTGGQSRLPGHGGSLSCLAVSGSGRLATGGRDGRVLCWGTDLAAPQWQFQCGQSWPRRLGWDAAGVRLVVGADDGSLSLWDVDAGRRADRPRHRGPVVAVEAGDGGRVYSAGEDGRLIVSDAGAAEPLANVHVGAPVTALVRTGAGTVGVGSSAGEVVVYRLVEPAGEKGAARA
jgi:WD40 repeat protein